MRFVSTRGGASAVGWEEAICAGYATDGGLYVPEAVPTISLDLLKEWSALPFAQLVARIVQLFVGNEIPPEDLQKICTDSFWSAEEVVPVKKVGAVLVAELFHGPTLAFKDFGQQVLCRMLDYFAVKRNRDITLVVSTTGDTGPAAIRATAGSQRLRIVCTYPKGQVSRLQERQMTTVNSPSVRVFAFEGGGDDMDGPIKQITTDAAFATRHGLTSVNSINLGRVTVQAAHFFWSYFQAIKQTAGAQVGDPIVIVIPTGAMGNIAAGELSRVMGLPVSKYCACVNANDITHRAFSRGEFWKAPIVRTLSEAINIQVPYNFERLLYFVTRDDVAVKAAMETMAATGKLTLSPTVHAAFQARYESAMVSDSEMLATMRSLHAEYNYLADPHGAVAFAGADQLGFGLNPPAGVSSRTPRKAVVVLATAHPCKFEEAVRVGLGDRFWDHDMTLPPSAAALETLPEVGGLAAGNLFVAGPATDAVGVTLDAAPGGKWERRLRGLIDGSVAGGFGKSKL